MKGFAHVQFMQDKLRAYNSRLHAAVRNGRGYDVAQRARGKFTHIAPVWYQVRGAEGNLELNGDHDFGAGWLQSLRTSSDKVALTSTSGHNSSGCCRIVCICHSGLCHSE